MSDTETTSTTNGGGTAMLASLSESDRATWQMTGELPKSAPAEPTPAAEPDDDEPDDKPATEPAEPDAKTPPVASVAVTAEKPISKRQQQINDLIRTRTEAEQRAAKLEARLAEVEGRIANVPAKEKPEPAKPEPIVDPKDPEPDLNTYEDYNQYLRDFTRWQIRQDKREAAAEQQRADDAKRADEARQAAAKRIDGWIGRRDAFAASNHVFVEKALPFLDGVYPGTPIGDTIMDSPVGAAIALHLAEHPDVLERIQSAGPIVALRELGKLEAQFDTNGNDSEMTRASASAGPAAKTVTTAPVPPTTLAARSADPADPLDAALKDRDFRRYEAEANKRDLAGAKR